MSSFDTKPIKDNKEIVEHMNEFRLLQTVRSLILRVDNLEVRNKELEGRVKTLEGGSKLTKEGNRIGRYEEYVNEILEDGRIYSIHSLKEEIQLRYPSVPDFNVYNLAASCGKMAKQGRITKIAHGNYRKNVNV